MDRKREWALAQHEKEAKKFNMNEECKQCDDVYIIGRQIFIA